MIFASTFMMASAYFEDPLAVTEETVVTLVVERMRRTECFHPVLLGEAVDTEQ